MSDSAHQGDAARLEAALERIVQALGRATMPPDAATPPQDAAVPNPATQLPGVPGTAAIDVAQIGARLDGLIAELRDVLGRDGLGGDGLGKDGGPPGAPAQS